MLSFQTPNGSGDCALCVGRAASGPGLASSEVEANICEIRGPVYWHNA